MNGAKPSPRVAKIIPPTSSFFHAKSRMANKINVGIKWIKKSFNWFVKDSCELNASVANIPIKHIANIEMILGAQWISFKVEFMWKK